MVLLQPDECRVLGVLVEKALTTPQQYPLTLNALTLGCNQKNNRFPVVNWDEDRVLDAVDGLRAKGLVREAMLSGSRVAKFRQLAREVYEFDTAQLVLMTELWLRGPQSVGDLRQHASRMHALASLEDVQGLLDTMIGRGLVREFPPPPGSRAKIYAQLVCPNLHAIDARAGEVRAGVGTLETSDADDASHSIAGTRASAGVTEGTLAARVGSLEREVASLRSDLQSLRASLGA